MECLPTPLECLPTLWKRGQNPVETRKNPVETGEKCVEKGSEPCGNGSINWFFLFQLLSYPLPTCTILSQAAEKYDSKMFIRSKIMGNREDYYTGQQNYPGKGKREAKYSG